MSEIVNKIKYAMSLRTPQEEALSYLDAISSHCDYKKDSKDVVEAAASEYCEKQRKVKAEFDFPSFCYAMATGIGKTRLMGASIYYLYKTKGYKHFFILAPGNTIYDKLRKESILRTLLTVIPNDSSRSFWKKTRMLSVGLNRL